MTYKKFLPISLFFSSLYIIMPTYHDLHGASSRGETFAFLFIFFIIFNGLFYYLYYNIQSKFWWRKYVISLANIAVIGCLMVMGFYKSSDISTFGAMILIMIVSFPVLLLVEIIEFIWQKIHKKT